MYARFLPILLLAGCASAPPTASGPAALPSMPEAGLGQDRYAAACEAWDDWDKPAPPYRILGNSWYVGTCGITAILIADPAGHILIDSGTAKGGELVLENLRTIGVDPKDIRYLVASHEHFDHVGGHALLKQATGATLVSSAEAAEVLRTGKVAADDPQALSGHPDMTPVEPDRIIADGETLTLGETKLTAHATPGHTSGALSWTWTACATPEEPPVCRRIAYVDSLSPISSDAYRFSDHPTYVARFRESLRKVAELPCDIMLNPHPSASDGIEKQEPHDSYNRCPRYAKMIGERLDKRLAEEAGG